MLDRVVVKGKAHGRVEKQLNVRLSVGSELKNSLHDSDQKRRLLRHVLFILILFMICIVLKL